LHDGLGQRLTGIAFLSKSLEQKLQEQELPEAVDTARVTDLINEVILQTKELARGLHPVDAEPTGLMTALSRWADHITSVFDLSCRFECPEPVRVTDNALATQLYRIAQEAAHNAVKHACATQMTIRLTAEGGTSGTHRSRQWSRLFGGTQCRWRLGIADHAPSCRSDWRSPEHPIIPERGDPCDLFHSYSLGNPILRISTHA
jgi:signal transduction histidine kinase